MAAIVPVLVAGLVRLLAACLALSVLSVDDAAAATTGTTGTTSGDPAFLPPGAATSFAKLERGSGGKLGIALAPLGDGPVETLGSLTTGHAWSTIKVPIVTALEARDGALTGAQATDARAALTRSDNDAAARLFGALGALEPASQAVEAQLRAAGDTRTKLSRHSPGGGLSTYGQTRWSAAAATTYYRALAAGCLLDAKLTASVRSLMAQVASDQRWGLGQAGLPSGTRYGFKGGWGPEAGGHYLVRQSGIVGSGTTGWAVTIIARSNTTGGGAFGAGTKLVTQAATWARRQLGTGRSFPALACP